MHSIFLRSEKTLFGCVSRFKGQLWEGHVTERLSTSAALQFGTWLGDLSTTLGSMIVVADSLRVAKIPHTMARPVKINFIARGV